MVINRKLKFTTDGCSSVPDFIFEPACWRHDFAYRFHYSCIIKIEEAATLTKDERDYIVTMNPEAYRDKPISKLGADFELAKDMKALEKRKGFKYGFIMPTIYFLGVTFFGKNPWAKNDK